LEHLYESVVCGGFVIVNDYGLYQGCRKAVDEFLGQLQPVPFLAKVDAEIRYWIKCDRGTGTESTHVERL
jgi:O-methyltransferase